jgi:predicted DNA-binding transcriptional regulator
LQAKTKMPSRVVKKQLSKGQMIGGAILAVCVIVVVGYLVLVVDPGLFSLNAIDVRLDAVLILVSAAFIAILGIGGWIGYTMATTPPPKPIEEITAEAQTENKTPPT